MAEGWNNRFDSGTLYFYMIEKYLIWLQRFLLQLIEIFRKSPDPLAIDLARLIELRQEATHVSSETARIDYDPQDLIKPDPVKFISRQIHYPDNGFDSFDFNDRYELFDDFDFEISFEALICKYPERFPVDVSEVAKQREIYENELFQPTADKSEIFNKVDALRKRTGMEQPEGLEHPKRIERTVYQYERDPMVVAYVLNCANGQCELCRDDAPFINKNGNPYLEVHHVKPLAEGGSDRISNAAALCPNCHRAVHLANDYKQLTASLYDKVKRLRPE